VVPPIERLHHNVQIALADNCVIAKWRQNAGPIPMPEPRQRRKLEMVIVIMRNEHGIDRRQVIEGDTRRVSTLRPNKGKWACSVRAYWIGQDIEPRAWIRKVAWPTKATRGPSWTRSGGRSGVKRGGTDPGQRSRRPKACQRITSQKRRGGLPRGLKKRVPSK
jgi:hypothetical protein